MLRALLLFAALVALAAAAAWFADRPGVIALDWQGWRLETSLAVGVLALLILVFALFAVFRIARRIVRGPAAFLARRQEARRRRGYDAVSQGLVAVAAGDAREARRLAQRAGSLLDDPPLTLLLNAQAAQLDGDEAAAARYFEAMCQRPETAFLGLRGLLVQAKRRGDTGAALALARRANELRPNTPWVLNELTAMEIRQADWQAAQRTIEQAEKHRAIEADTARRQRAVVLFAQAQAAEDRGETKLALDLALQVHKLQPDFVPAASAAARASALSGRERRARKLLEDAWRREPHPSLASAYAGLRPSETSAARLQRMRRLAAQAPEHLESRIALAEAALAAGDWVLAREQLDAAAAKDMGVRVCRLMADLEEREHQDIQAARRWLRRAAATPSDPTWVCQTCARQVRVWAAHCPDCSDFDSFRWRRPAGDIASAEVREAALEDERADATRIAPLAPLEPDEAGEKAAPDATDAGDAPEPDDEGEALSTLRRAVAPAASAEPEDDRQATADEPGADAADAADGPDGAEAPLDMPPSDGATEEPAAPPGPAKPVSTRPPAALNASEDDDDDPATTRLRSAAGQVS